jgi:CheY-like chemotaxis protein
MPDASANIRMLVVDDETIIADSLAAICRLRGLDAVAVYSGEDAVKDAMAHPPAVLLTDISMNGMNGIETAIRVLRVFPSCRVLLISGHPESGGLLEKARDHGYAFDVLTKPVHPKKIFDWLDGKNSG